jgi:hypothetical protein
MIVQSDDLTTTIDFEDFLIPLENTTFAGTISSHSAQIDTNTTNIAALCSEVAQLSYNVSNITTIDVNNVTPVSNNGGGSGGSTSRNSILQAMSSTTPSFPWRTLQTVKTDSQVIAAQPLNGLWTDIVSLCGNITRSTLSSYVRVQCSVSNAIYQNGYSAGYRVCRGSIPIGVPGDILYYDESAPGGITTAVTARAAYIKLTSTSAMVMEEGLSSTPVSVYANLGLRPLTALVGQIAYVTDTGNGEWGLYVYSNSSWVQVSNADSAITDARSLVVSFSMPLGGSNVTQDFGNVSPGRKITSISVAVSPAFANYSSPPTLTVGTGDLVGANVFMTAEASDLTEVNTYVTYPEHFHPTNSPGEMIVRARLDHNSAQTGNAIVKLTYV